jgi:hypothetical protein
MERLNMLKEEFGRMNRKYLPNICDYLMYRGYREHYSDDPLTAKAYATVKLFKKKKKYIYDNDLIVGSAYGKFSDRYSQAELANAEKITVSFGKNHFWTNADHFAADFETILKIGTIRAGELAAGVYVFRCTNFVNTLFRLSVS